MNLYQRYTVKAQPGTISDEGIRQINALVARQNLTDGEWQLANPGTDRRFLPALPESFLWQWQGEADGFRGTFPKRVAQFYFKGYQVKLPWAFTTELGNIARQHSADDVVYEFEFVNRIDWEAGDFGDRFSCYWGSNAGALEMLNDNGALAVRFYDADGDGIARAWVVKVGDDLLIIFNGYGFSGDATLIITRVVAQSGDADYREIRLTNHGTGSGVLHINGSKGYIVGPADVIAAYDHYNLEWEETYVYECAECGHGLGEDEVYWGPDDSPYCEYCYAELTSFCTECGQTYWDDEVIHVGDRYLCRACAALATPPPQKPARQGKK